jgi:hypothetical protein
MMLIDYIRAAIGHARYELLDDDEGFYGDIGRNLLARVLGKLASNARTGNSCR